MLSQELDGKVSAATLRANAALEGTLAVFAKEATAKIVELESLEGKISVASQELAELDKNLAVAQKDKEIELGQWEKTATLRSVKSVAQELGHEVLSNEEAGKLRTTAIEAENAIKREVAITVTRMDKEKSAAVAEVTNKAALDAANDKANLANALATIDELRKDKAALLQQNDAMRSSWEKSSSTPVTINTSSK